MAEEQKTAPAAAAQESVVHRLIVSLVGGQEFTLNAVTNSTDIPADYVASSTPGAKRRTSGSRPRTTRTSAFA